MMKKRMTDKSVVYEFDGFCPVRRAYIQGAFRGTFIVPRKWAHLIPQGGELESLIDMHESREYGIVLRDKGVVR